MTEWLSLPPIPITTHNQQLSACVPHTLIYNSTYLLFSNSHTVAVMHSNNLQHLNQKYNIQIQQYIHLIELNHEFGNDTSDGSNNHDGDSSAIPATIITAFQHVLQASHTSDAAQSSVNVVVPTFTPICTISFLLRVISLCGFKPKYVLR